MPETDLDLIRACQDGDAQAWERLLGQYERLVFSIPLRYGLTADDAADITQLTFTILIQSLSGLRADTRLAPWLATVARRHTWRLLAHRRREAVDPDGDLSEDRSLASASEEVDRWERLEWVRHGLSLLDERCRRLLHALYLDLEEPSYAEVARRMHMPVGSIGPTRARCLEQMRRQLALLDPVASPHAARPAVASAGHT
jgi:RNA polymerase sigma factor (sigma-70 family)